MPTVSSDGPRRSVGSAGAAATALTAAPNKGRRVRHRAKHAALHLDHLDGGQMVAGVGRAAAILQQQTLEAAVVALAHRRVHADVGGDAGQHDVLDPFRAQDQFQIGGAERTLARLIDDDLARQRLQFVDDLPTGLAAHQDLAAGAGVADTRADAARPPALVGG